jgi:rubrerythrin
MFAFKNLKDILKVSVDWEKKLKDLYDVAEFGLSNQKSKEVIIELNKRHVNKLEIMQNLDVEKYGLNEWVRYASDYKEDEIIPKHEIRRESTPEEIFSILIECESRIKGFYSSIAEILITEKQKELFNSLAQFKENQIEEILNLRNNSTE